MKGTRVQPDENGWFNGGLNPGEYVKIDPKCMADGSPLPDAVKKAYPLWICESPNGHGGSLANHQITEHEDGTITVSPSILIRMKAYDCTATKFEDIKWVELWHGYLERGVWRSC